MRAEELKGHLDALLLAALEGGPRHGYAVIETLRQDTGGRLDLPTGTIYPALRRLEKDALILGNWENKRNASSQDRPRRRYYHLTREGKDTLSGALRRYPLLSQLAPAEKETKPVRE